MLRPDSAQTSNVSSLAFCACCGLGPRWCRPRGRCCLRATDALVSSIPARPPRNVAIVGARLPSRLSHYGLHSPCLRFVHRLATANARLGTARALAGSSSSPHPRLPCFRRRDLLPHRLRTRWSVTTSFRTWTCPITLSAQTVDDHASLSKRQSRSRSARGSNFLFPVCFQAPSATVSACSTGSCDVALQ